MKQPVAMKAYLAPECDVLEMSGADDCLLNISQFGIGGWTDGDNDWFSEM